MRTFILALMCSAWCVTAVQGQPTLRIIWNQDDTSPEEAATWTYQYYLDGLLPVVLHEVSCGTVNERTECSAPFPIPSVGYHTVQMSGSNQYGESEKSELHLFKYPNVPHAPGNVLVVREQD